MPLRYLSFKRTLELAGIDSSDAEEIANRESLEQGYEYGRVVWHDPYPFVDELVVEKIDVVDAPPAEASEEGVSAGHAPGVPAAAPAASGASGESGTASSVREQKRWRRHVSWELGRMLPDLRWHLLDHHFCIAPFTAHSLSLLRRWERFAILLSSVGVALWMEFLLEEEVDANTAEAVADLRNSTLLDEPAELPRLEHRIAASAETLDVWIGAVIVTLWEQLTKLIGAPMCVPFTWLVESGAMPRGRCVRGLPAAIVGYVGLFGMVLGGVAIGLSQDRTKSAVDAGLALLNATVLSAAADILGFLALRREQLSWFGQPSVQRARTYPHGLSRPPSEWLRSTRWRYKPAVTILRTWSRARRAQAVPPTPPPTAAAVSFADGGGDDGDDTCSMY